MKVRFTEAARGIELESGEALFEVAKGPRPFVVRAGSHEVTAEAVVDRPVIDEVLAVKRGQIAFEDTPLAAPRSDSNQPGRPRSPSTAW